MRSTGWPMFPCLVVAVGASVAVAQEKELASPPAAPPEFKTFAEKTFQELVRPYLEANCFRCHGNKKITSGLNLETLKPDFLDSDTAEQWQVVYERMRDGEMPPPPPGRPGREEPSPAGQQAAARSLLQIVTRGREWRKDDQVSLAPLEIKDTDDRPMRLQKQRRNAAAASAREHRAQIERGIGQSASDLKSYAEAVRRLYEVELELVKGTPQEISALRQQLANWRTAERFVWERYHADIDPVTAFLDIKAQRIEAQLQLHHAIQRVRQ